MNNRTSTFQTSNEETGNVLGKALSLAILNPNPEVVYHLIDKSEKVPDAVSYEILRQTKNHLLKRPLSAENYFYLGLLYQRLAYRWEKEEKDNQAQSRFEKSLAYFKKALLAGFKKANSHWFHVLFHSAAKDYRPDILKDCKATYVFFKSREGYSKIPERAYFVCDYYEEQLKKKLMQPEKVINWLDEMLKEIKTAKDHDDDHVSEIDLGVIKNVKHIFRDFKQDVITNYLAAHSEKKEPEPSSSAVKFNY